ncbi:ABC transporter substrate-binding protein [Notoacmeibacter sp. MSK16QG-6]|uniref:ABC transporter substrate-binding protein n=1 Tax=Notoacmeibacter sp. MSK16QG-6 TaxID=2957982 RepID=UPI0020A2056F|nr:ABC transporter substrate-binding protein [Notoacmeibacter sp. MSK16QG-6]MCP1200245.1 ABC transporter substrate-binding protein [Notoacmeibacter sp. MSK16QG-6]
MTSHNWLRSLVAVGALVAFSGTAYAAGTLRYATVGEPPSLDQQVITSDLSTTIAHHIFEGLYTFNAKNEPVPLLASGETVSDDGKTIVIALREGVKFHNGEDMTAADVVASLKRWGEFGSRGNLLFDHVESVEATGDHEVTLKLTNPFGPWKNLMAFINGGPSIYPASVVEGATKEPIGQDGYIGTGPYKFSAWEPNRKIELVRFEDYTSPEGEADGYGGERTAEFDTLDFMPVPDVGARIAGVRAGDYDYAESIPGDLYEELKNDETVTTILNGGPIFGLVFMNSSEGPLKENFALRRAIQTALDKTTALQVAIGPEDLWRANGSFLPDGNVWYNDAGTENFSKGDAEAAKTMAQEAGYSGEPIKFMVSTNYPFHYDTAIVYTKQLANAGFNIDLQVYDWATLIEKRAQPDQWDLFFTHHGFVPDPILISVMNDTYPGWWATPEKTELKDKFTASSDPAEREKIWGEIQTLIYEQVPTMKTGDIYTYNIASSKLQGLGEATLIWPSFWNVSKE